MHDSPFPDEPGPGRELPFDQLPFIDEHAVRVPMPAPIVWQALIDRLARTGLGIPEPLARLLGACPARGDGHLPETGSTLPGFAVSEAVPHRRLVLTGRHHFSRYALVLVLDEEASGTVLRARSYATFPGALGWGYRQLVIGSRAHRILMERLVRSFGRQAERTAAG